MAKYKTIQEIGNRYERLLVVDHGDKKCGATRWLVRCDCGVEKLVCGVNLRKGHVRSCGCLQKELAAERQSKPKGDSLWNTVISTYIYGANKRALSWELKRDEAIKLMSKNCHYCGTEPSNRKTTANKKDTISYSGMDRQDNELGYTSDNCVPCCQTCNFAKAKMNSQEFLCWVGRVYEVSLRKA